MSKQILDYDPLSGITTYMEVKPDSRMEISYVQDVTPILSQNKRLAADRDRSKKGIKDDWWHYARIPEGMIPMLEQKHGLKFNDKNDLPRLLALINTEYQALKVTDLQHNIKHA